MLRKYLSKPANTRTTVHKTAITARKTINSSNKEEITDSKAAGWTRKQSERAYPIERGQNISK